MHPTLLLHPGFGGGFGGEFVWELVADAVLELDRLALPAESSSAQILSPRLLEGGIIYTTVRGNERGEGGRERERERGRDTETAEVSRNFIRKSKIKKRKIKKKLSTTT